MYIQELKDKFNHLYNHYFEQLKTIRTNKISPVLLDNILVDAYGSKQKINTLANISVQLPNILILEIWDFSIVNDVVKSLETSNLNIPVQKEQNKIKLIFPPVTEERRMELLKIVNQEKEKANINLKQLRDEMMKLISKDFKDKTISEDDKFKYEKEVQKEIDNFKQEIEDLSEKKNKEIKTI